MYDRPAPMGSYCYVLATPANGEAGGGGRRGVIVKRKRRLSWIGAGLAGRHGEFRCGRRGDLGRDGAGRARQPIISPGIPVQVSVTVEEVASND